LLKNLNNINNNLEAKKLAHTQEKEKEKLAKEEKRQNTGGETLTANYFAGE